MNEYRAEFTYLSIQTVVAVNCFKTCSLQLDSYNLSLLLPNYRVVLSKQSPDRRGMQSKASVSL